MSDIGRAVRVLRASAGKTQKALAADSELSAAYVSQIESGLKEPTVTSLRRIAEALDADLAALLALADDSTALPATAAIATHGASGRAARPSSRSSGNFRRSRADAESLLRDPFGIRELVAKVRTLAAQPGSERLGDVQGDLRDLVALLEAYGERRHLAVPWESLVLVAAALLYFVASDDIVPDHLDEGYIDDAAILTFVTEMVAPDLAVFLGPAG